MVTAIDTPRLVVAAPASGHGKTTVATGLLAALRARGLTVSPHKVGPDYIDPGYHGLAAGRVGRNLDPVLCGSDLIAPLFAHGADSADIAVVEGVMGLYDGRGSGSQGSTAHVARMLEAPVVLVVDAASQGRSVAALVSGFAAYDARVRLGGVVLNRVGSGRHADILRAALADLGVPVLGVLRRADDVDTPSRHLGLVPVAERRTAATKAVERLGALVAEAVDLEAMVALAKSAPSLSTRPWRPEAAVAASTVERHVPHGSPALRPEPQGQPEPPVRASRRRQPRRTGSQRPVRAAPTVAVAGGAAFSFCYAETTELLAAAGAHVVTFDPLSDEYLPRQTRAVVIGGGFPEEYAGTLSANATLRGQLAQLAETGAPITAECAGLVYLGHELDGLPMCGVLPTRAEMTERLRLGYRTAVAATDSVLAPAQTTVVGHEFHRTTVQPGHSSPAAWTIEDRQEGFVTANVHASYVHLHWAAHPRFVQRLVEAAR